MVRRRRSRALPPEDPPSATSYNLLGGVPVPFLKILDGIQHHQDKIGRLGRRNHLASPTLLQDGGPR
eukprot:scaffold1142_cov387-Prasinococcus_capsulatus_cf.AAC.3